MFVVMDEANSIVRELNQDELAELRADPNSSQQCYEKMGPVLFISLDERRSMGVSCIDADTMPQMIWWIKDFLLLTGNYSLINEESEILWSPRGFVVTDEENGKSFWFRGDQTRLTVDESDLPDVLDAILLHVNSNSLCTQAESMVSAEKLCLVLLANKVEDDY